MEIETPVAEATRRLSPRRALVLVLRTCGLVLLWWLLATTAAHADSGGRDDRDADRPAGATDLVGTLADRTLEPARAAPATRAVLHHTAAATRTTTDRTTAAVRSGTDTATGGALTPVVDAVLAVAEDVATPALDSVDPTVDPAVDPAVDPVVDPVADGDAPPGRPDRGVAERSSPADRHGTRPAVVPGAPTWDGAAAGALATAAAAPLTVSGDVPEHPAAPATAPSLPDYPADGSTDSSSGTDATGGPSALTFLSHADAPHRGPLAWVQTHRRCTPPSIPAREPGSTPD